MELSDLNSDERLALVALIKATALADRNVSEDEQDMLAGIADELGEEAYQKAFETADERFAREPDLKAFLQGIKRQEAREIIYGTVLDLAMADAVSEGESPLLRWLASTWNVEASIEPGEDDEV